MLPHHIWPLAGLSTGLVPLVALDRAIVSVILLVFGGFLLRGTFSTYRTTRLMADTPTETVRSMAAGRTELEGAVQPVGEPLPEPFGEGEAVLATYEIGRHDPDAEGDEPSWVTTERGTLVDRFELDDGTGAVEVAATEDADLYISDENSSGVTVGRDEPEPRAIREFLAEHTDRDVDPDGEGSIYPRKHSYRQEVVPPGEEVYVFGSARVRDDEAGSNGERLVVERDDATGRFVLSDMGEDALSTGLQRRVPVLFVLGLVLSVVGFRLALIELGIA